jgi:hypothetical protein
MTETIQSCLRWIAKARLFFSRTAISGRAAAQKAANDDGARLAASADASIGGAPIGDLAPRSKPVENPATDMQSHGEQVKRALDVCAAGDVWKTTQVLRLLVVASWSVAAANLFLLRTNTMIAGKKVTPTGMPIDDAARLYDIYLLLAAAGGVVAVMIFLLGIFGGRFADQGVKDRSRIFGRSIAVALNALDRRLRELRRKFSNSRDDRPVDAHAFEAYGAAREFDALMENLDFLGKPFDAKTQMADAPSLKRFERFLERCGPSQPAARRRAIALSGAASGFFGLMIGVLISGALMARNLDLSFSETVRALGFNIFFGADLYEGHFALIMGGVILYLLARLIAVPLAGVLFQQTRKKRLEYSFYEARAAMVADHAPQTADLAAKAEALTAMAQRHELKGQLRH